MAQVTSPGTRNVLWAPLPKFHDLTLKAHQVAMGGQVRLFLLDNYLIVASVLFGPG